MIDDVPVWPKPKGASPSNVVMIEGLSLGRASNVCASLAYKHGYFVPQASRMQAARQIKISAFGVASGYRDPKAVTALMLGLRRACYVDYTSNVESDQMVALRVHMLSSYSSVRCDSFTLTEWTDMVGAIFGDSLPKTLAFLDYTDEAGKIDISQADGLFKGNAPPTPRDLDSVIRDCDRRVDAMYALHATFGTEIIRLPTGPYFQSEATTIATFVKDNANA